MDASPITIRTLGWMFSMLRRRARRARQLDVRVHTTFDDGLRRPARGSEEPELMHVDILNLGDRPEGVCSVRLLAKPRNRRIRSPLTQWLLRDRQPPGRTTREAPVRLTLPLAEIGGVLHESHRVSQVAIGVVLASSGKPAYLPRRRSARRRLARNLCAAVEADRQQRMRAVEHRPRRNRAAQEAIRRAAQRPSIKRDELA